MRRDDFETGTEDRQGYLAEDNQSQNFHNRQDIEMTYHPPFCVKVFPKSLIEGFFMRCRIRLSESSEEDKNSSPACPLLTFVTALRTSLPISEI